MRKRKNKAGLIRYFFNIVLALVIFIPTLLIGAKLFAATNQSDESFDKLIGYVDNIAGDSSLASDNIPLYMSKDTLIMFINPDIKSVFGTFSKDNSNFFMSRPLTGSCKPDESCICLCKDYKKGDMYSQIPASEKDYPIRKQMDYYKPICNKMVCKPVDAEFISGADVWFRQGKGSGAIITREKDDAKLRTLYLEKYNGSIAVCFESPCIVDTPPQPVRPTPGLEAI